MSRGSFKVEAPHICGQMIEVTINWTHDSGTYWEPPSDDEDWDCPENCPTCGILLEHDILFLALVEKLAQHVYEHGDTGEVSPYDLEPPGKEWDLES